MPCFCWFGTNQGNDCKKSPLINVLKQFELSTEYHKVGSSNTSCLEAHVDFFRLLMKAIFGPYVL